MSLQNHWLRAAGWALVVALSIAVFAVVFQSSGRYRYEKLGGIMWRVDQISGQRCRVIHGNINCTPLKTGSMSTSTSLSTSTSVSARAQAHPRAH